MLEPYAMKVACTVLKGLGVGNDLRLLDNHPSSTGSRRPRGDRGLVSLFPVPGRHGCLGWDT